MKKLLEKICQMRAKKFLEAQTSFCAYNYAEVLKGQPPGLRKTFNLGEGKEVEVSIMPSGALYFKDNYPDPLFLQTNYNSIYEFVLGCELSKFEAMESLFPKVHRRDVIHGDALKGFVEAIIRGECE